MQGNVPVNQRTVCLCEREKNITSCQPTRLIRCDVFDNNLQRLLLEDSSFVLRQERVLKRKVRGEAEARKQPPEEQPTTTKVWTTTNLQERM